MSEPVQPGREEISGYDYGRSVVVVRKWSGLKMRGAGPCNSYVTLWTLPYTQEGLW